MLNWEPLHNANIPEYPFPHVRVEEVFSEYPMLCRSLPETEAYRPMVTDRTGKVLRYHCEIETLPDAPWPALTAELRDVALWHWVQTIFSPADLPDYQTVDIRLFRDVPGYHLLPHTDARSKIATLIFFLAVNRQHQGWGTRLYTSGVDGQADTLLVPYQPNTLLGFVRSETSWHGCSPITGVRDTLQVIYRSAVTEK